MPTSLTPNDNNRRQRRDAAKGLFRPFGPLWLSSAVAAAWVVSGAMTPPRYPNLPRVLPMPSDRPQAFAQADKVNPAPCGPRTLPGFAAVSCAPGTGKVGIVWFLDRGVRIEFDNRPDWVPRRVSGVFGWHADQICARDACITPEYPGLQYDDRRAFAAWAQVMRPPVPAR